MFPACVRAHGVDVRSDVPGQPEGVGWGSKSLTSDFPEAKSRRGQRQFHSRQLCRAQFLFPAPECLSDFPVRLGKEGNSAIQPAGGLCSTDRKSDGQFQSTLSS